MIFEPSLIRSFRMSTHTITSWKINIFNWFLTIYIQCEDLANLVNWLVIILSWFAKFVTVSCYCIFHLIIYVYKCIKHVSVFFSKDQRFYFHIINIVIMDNNGELYCFSNKYYIDKMGEARGMMLLLSWDLTHFLNFAQ